jgi:membrane protein required for colicin V production
MVETSFNIFDTIVLGIVVLSALLSFFRGFVREVLSLGAWVGASLITLYTFMDVAALINPQVNNPTISSGLAAMGVFIFSLMGISILTALMMKMFKQGKDIGMLDNILGLGFGILRACLLISLAYFIFSFFMPEEDYPEWLKTAHTRSYVESGAVIIAKMAPDYLESLTPIKESIVAKQAEKTEPSASEDTWMRVEELERMIEDRSTDKN